MMKRIARGRLLLFNASTQQSFDRLTERSDVIFLMPSGHSYAQPRGAFCHGWIPNCWNEESFISERSGQIQRCLLVADNPRKDGAAGDHITW
jgi:hypothetical protein